MKKVLSIFTLLLLMAATMQAQEKKPDWMRWHYLSEEEMYDKSRGMNFVETDPPTGEPRFVAEFEPMQGVMIRYPLGIPTSLVAQLSNNCMVYCIVSNSQQNSAQYDFQNAGVNMDNVTFVNAPSDSYWVRDYGPWYIFEDRNPAIVDNIYNRPRPNDDNMSQVFANFWQIPMYGMRLEHTGGNMMEDGRGHGVSDDLVFQENLQDYGIDEATVRQRMNDYLGINPYHVTIDPQGDYIAHVDCWGKYLAPDKILIAQLPESNPRYQYYEQVAEYFETTNCCWGYPYRVYRVFEPGGYTLAPYTNSLILNKTVYVPLGTNNTYNNDALAVYQEAMPGYEIVGVTNNGYTGWENTDALHCRTRGVMDFHMLFVDHRDVLFGEQEWQDSIPVVSKFIAYSGANLKQDSLLVYYSIDGGAYQTAHMTATGNPDEYVGYIKGYQGESEINYYVFGADESGHRYTQPVFADLDPHHFTMEAHDPPTPQGELVITPDTLWFTQMGQERQFNIINETNEAVTIIDVVPEAPSFNLWDNTFPYTLQPGETLMVTINFQSAPGKDTYIPYEILVQTTLGDRIVMGMVLNTSLDSGFVIVGAPVVEFNEPDSLPQQVCMQNRFFGSQIPVKVLAVTENETNYLRLEPHGTLPYTVEPADYFYLDVYVNALAKGYVVTTFTVQTDQNDCTYSVAINEDLLSVNELTAEAKLYPNPTTGLFTVEGANVAKVEVYNLVGQKVHEAEGKTVSIDAADWNKGIYLVNIIEEKGAVVTKKLVVR
jgi:agmatine/peptidylarginine deiminase